MFKQEEYEKYEDLIHKEDHEDYHMSNEDENSY